MSIAGVFPVGRVEPSIRGREGATRKWNTPQATVGDEMGKNDRGVSWIAVATVLAAVASGGCQTGYSPCNRPEPGKVYVPPDMPRELSKVVLPPYTIEPPDILLIDAIRIVPKQPYYLRTGDVLAIEAQGQPKQLRPGDNVDIQVEGALPEAPIMGVLPVGSTGVISLGPGYGAVQVAGMTVDEARDAIEKHLKQILAEPIVSLNIVQSTLQPLTGNFPVQMGGVVSLPAPYGTVAVAGKTVEEAQQAIADHLGQFFDKLTASVVLAEFAGKQQIIGEHLVTPDGTVTLGTYGSVPVVGMTLDEARMAIENHLSQFLEDPEISVTVYAYNSKVYYVILQGAGSGDGVYRFPVTGNETVLDAISQINGLDPSSSTEIWIARPTPNSTGVQMLPVDWHGITAEGLAATNYQILPGDRIYVANDKMLALNAAIAKFTLPFERVMGFSLLGVGTVTRFSGNVLRGGGSRFATF
ncbi:MAG TPA: hypothetical protein EYH34_07200 [Planctomycetes bacterium]|nr:hypothetical protein [Planctomycetota bacterium]